MGKKSLLRLIIGNVMSEFIGGCENVLEDCEPSDEEYIYSKWFLNQSHDELIDFIYGQLMEELEKPELKHLKFIGTETIKKLISANLTSWGY